MFRFQFQRFFDAAGSPGPGGPAPGGSPAPSPAPAPAAGPAAPAPGAGGGPAPGPPAAPAPRQFSYAEDRSRWIPPHRLEETTNRYRDLESRFNHTQAQLRAVMGLTQPPNPEHVALRSSLSEIVPELAPILRDPRAGQALAKILELASTGRLDQVMQRLDHTEGALWNGRAYGTAREMVSAYAKMVGVEPDKVNPKMLNRMARELTFFIQEDETGERQRRFEYGDPALMQECMAELEESYVAPVRRTTNTNDARNVERNQRVPQRGPAGGPQPGANQPQRRTRDETRRAAREFVLANR